LAFGRNSMNVETAALDTATPTDSIRSCRLSTNRKELKVGDVMSREIVTATTSDTVFAAAKKMSDNNISCIVVTDDEMVIGILTDKDILKGIAGNDRDFHRLLIGQRMSSPVEVVAADDSLIAAGKRMEAKGIKRLPVVDAGALVGIVTQTDITRGLIAVSPLGAVSDIMTVKITVVDVAASAAEAARIMATNGISCLVATHRQEVAGIVTEKDLLRRVVALYKDPEKTQVVDIMSFPIVAIPPSYSVLSAGKKMETMRLHRLVVMDRAREVCGIITQTDIMRSVRHELERIEQSYPSLDAELQNLIGRLMADTERLRELLAATGEIRRENH
jgi:CBS domain-containing protein